jgi:hypothetical protein
MQDEWKRHRKSGRKNNTKTENVEANNEEKEPNTAK